MDRLILNLFGLRPYVAELRVLQPRNGSYYGTPISTEWISSTKSKSITDVQG